MLDGKNQCLRGGMLVTLLRKCWTESDTQDPCLRLMQRKEMPVFSFIKDRLANGVGQGGEGEDGGREGSRFPRGVTTVVAEGPGSQELS